MHFVIDTRKAFDSGIGTYIRSVVPRVVAQMPHARFSALVAKGNSNRPGYLDPERVCTIEMASPALGIAEQVELRRVLPADAILWATSLAHPLFTRAPLVATVHDVAQLALGASGGSAAVRWSSRIYFASLRSRARGLIVNSQFTRDEFLRHVGVKPEQPITVTPLGVEADWFAAAAEAGDGSVRPYFVCVGNLRPHKNLRAMLAAFSQVMDRLPHDLVVIGQHAGFRTADPGFVAEMARLGGRVRFTGFVSDAELRRHVAAAQALVFPSLYEGFGLPALEAMAAGCPVVAARAGALPEVCGDAALLFDPHRPESLAAALQHVAALEPSSRARTVERGIARARGYTWERTAGLTVEALLQVAAGLS